MEHKKTYPPSWVVMQNNISECFKSMNIDEKRLLILASPIARTQAITEKDAIFITVDDFAKECGIQTRSAYVQLEAASKALIKRYFSYRNEKGKKVLSNWVIDCTYENGGISIRFPDIVLLMLTQFDKLNPYTKYKKNIVLNLKKDYSFDIYHLAKKYQAMGQFIMSLEDLNQELGLPTSYQDLSNLKKRVLNPSLDEITANTDIDLTYENVKRGRSVVGFKFMVKEKPKPKVITPGRDPNTLDMFFKMTDAQVTTYSSKLAHLPEFSYLATGNESYEVLASKIAKMLKDEEQQKIFVNALKTLGFKF